MATHPSPPTAAPPSDRVEFLGVQIDPLTVDQLLQRIAQIIDQRCRALVLNVNVHIYNLAASHPWLTHWLNKAEIVFCDGAGVMLGTRLLGKSIPERITYADWFWQLAALAEARGYTLFFLGAQPGVAQKAADRLRTAHPRLQIVGIRDGYFDSTPGSAENEAVLAAINAASPDVLTVGMGMPRQEQWLRDNWDRLDVRVALTGGAVFDYISGDLARAPRWMTDNGLEWLGRLLIEPKRLWRRYLLGNPRFLLRVLQHRLTGS